MLKKFRYDFNTVSKNWRSNDSNVYAYQFINIGFTALTLNGSSLITPNAAIPPTFNNISFQEQIFQGEKSETVYDLIFFNEADPLNAVLIISKILVN